MIVGKIARRWRVEWYIRAYFEYIWDRKVYELMRI